MEGWLEHLVKSVLSGEAKTQTLAAGLRALDGVRRLVIVHHLLLVTGLLCALSLFASGYVLFMSWLDLGALELSPVLLYCLAVFAVSGGALWYSCRSRTWAAAFGLERQLRAVIREYHEARAAAPAPIDVEALADAIEKIVDRKLQSERPHKSPSS